jgi:hypothetical protein
MIMLQLRIRNIKTGKCEDMPANIWEIFSGREDWQIMEPEQQYTPAPAGKSIRAEQSAPAASFDVGTLKADLSDMDIEVTMPDLAPVIEVKKKGRPRK